MEYNSVNIFYTRDFSFYIRKLLPIVYCFFRDDVSVDYSSQDYNTTFQTIVEKYDNLIRRICFGFSTSTEEMKDFHQDVMLNIWQALPKFRGDSSLKTWIYRIALNTCVSTVRSERKKKSVNNLPDVLDENEERKKMIMELHDMISYLGPVDKSIILLWLEEFSYEEISLIIGLPRNTIATRIRRAKEKLKDLK